MRDDSICRRKSRYAAFFLILLVIISIPAVTAEPLPDIRHIFIGVANDGGVKYDLDGPVFGGPDNTYYIKADGGGLNELHISNDVAQASGQVSTATNQSGTFYVTNTGGRGFDDDIVILLAVNGTIPDDFSVHIKTSGYNWTTSSVPNQVPTDYAYVEGAVDETFTKADFIYGPQTWKPGPGTLGVPSLPLYFGQDISDTSNAFQLMFIDLKVGNMYPSKFSGVTLEDNGAAKVEFSFTNLTTFATFNGYGWCLAANQGQGISWTNRMDDPGASGFSVVGIPNVPSPAPVADFSTSTTDGIAPLFVRFADSSTNTPTTWAWDFGDGSTSTEQNATHTYMSEGTYTVTLTATNSAGSDSEVKSGLVTVTAASTASGLADSAWPKFGGNAQNTGQSPYVGSKNGTPKWSYTVPGISGSAFKYTTPVIGLDGTIYLGDTASNISAINPDGTLKWETAIGIGSNSPFAIGTDGTLFVGGFDTGTLTNGKIYAVNPSDGTKKWTSSALTGACVYSGPAIGADGTVYGGNYLNQFCALFPENGTSKWSYTTGQIYNYGSPAIGYDGIVYVTSQSDKMLYAINPDGSPRWNFTAGGTFSNSPAIGADGTIYVACYDKNLYAINPDGSQKWNYTAGNYFYTGSPAIAKDGTIYAGNQDKNVYAIDSEGNLKWKSLLASRVWSTPTIGADGTVYIEDQNSILYALDPANGNQIWSYTTSGRVDGAASIAPDGTVYVATENRVLYAFPGVVDFTSDKANGSAPLAVQFNGISPLAVTAWNWDFGDGSTSAEQNPEHTFTSPGNYTVTLTITHADGTNFLEKTDYITVTGSAGSNTWIVDASGGGDFTTIGDAVAAAGSMDTIIIRNGTYTENIVADKKVTIHSENGPEGTIITANDPNVPTFTLTGNESVIEGLSFQGGSTALLMSGVSGCTVRDNILSSGTNGITMQDTRDNKIIDNTIDSFSNYAIRLGGSVSDIIAGNVITSCKYGISIDDEARMSNQVLILKNTLTNCNYGIFLRYATASGTLVSGNTIFCGANGIYLRDGAIDNIFTGNSISQTSSYAIYTRSTPLNNTFYLNTISGNVETIYNSDTSSIWNSTEPVTYTYQGSTFTGYVGNFWDLYAGTDGDGNGIGDEPFATGKNHLETDYYPLLQRGDYYSVRSQVPLLSAGFAANPTSGDTPFEVQFTDMSSGNPTSWAWDFENDGVVDSTEQNPSNTYTAEGIYSVKLTVTGDEGSNSVLKARLITVGTQTGRTWTVGPSGCDFTEIWDALVNPQLWNGDTIFVYPGTYNDPGSGTLKLSTEISLVGASRDQVFYNAGLPKYFYRPIKIEGISFLNSSKSVDLRGANTQIRNCSFDKFSQINFYADNIRFENNIVSETSNLRVGGFSFYPSNNNIVTNNSFSNMGRAIWLGGSNQTIADNTFSSCAGSEVIFVDMLSGSTLTRNAFTACTGALLRMNSPGGGNLIYFNDFDSANPITYNGPQGAISWNTTRPVTYTYQGASYAGYLGNHWAGYTGTDGDGNGLGDDPFVVPPSYGEPVHYDFAPLMGSYNDYMVDFASQSPTAYFTANVTSGEAPFTITFTDLSTGSPTSWAWDFDNDGIVDSTEQNPVYTYITVGIYSVNLTVTAGDETDSEIRNGYITVSEPSGPRVLGDYNNIFVRVANDDGVKYNAFGNDTYNIRFEGVNRGLNALHISTDPAVNFGQVTVTDSLSGTFYATDSGGKGYEDEVILLVAVNGTIPDDFSLRITSDGYTWTPNPVSNQPPSLENVTYQPVALDETFTKEDFIYGPQIWKPTGNEADYPLYAGQDLTDSNNTFHLMFIDVNAGVLRPNTDLENHGAVRINYTFGHMESVAAFSVYAYCQKSNNGDDMVAWTNALTSDKAMSGYSVIGKIRPPVAAINITPDTVFLTAGDNLQLIATAYDNESAVIPGIFFNWSSSDETVVTVNETGYLTAIAEGIATVTASSGDVSATTPVTVQRAETPAGGVIPATDNVYLKVANDNGARFDDFGDDSFHIIWTGGGLNALHISNGSSTSYEGEVTQTTERSGTFYVTTTGGRGYFDNIFLCVAVNGTIPDDFRLHIQADGYQWTPNPTPHSEPAPDTITYVNATLDEWFTKDDLTYGPQTWRPAAGTTYPIYAGQDVSDTSNQFRLMFIDLYGGALSAHSLRVRYEIENLSSMAAFNAYGYGQNANSVNDCLTTWTNDISSSGWTVLGPPAPVTNFNADKTAGDAPLTVMFTDTSSNAPVSWAWDFENDGIVDNTQQNPTHTYTAAGMYTVNLTASNVYGSDSEVKTNYILVSYDSVNFIADVTSGYAPLAVTFTDLSTGSPTSWAWDFENDGIIDSTEQNATHIYSAEGNYSVKLTITADNETKSSVKTDFIQVSPHIPKTWTVGSSGCDFVTLAGALGSPSVIEGDNVFVYNGTYVASGVLKPVSITGEGAEIVTLDLGGGTVRISGTGTVVENVRFTNGLLYFSSGGGVSVPPTGVIVRNCIFENMKNPSGQGSIYLGMSNNTLTGNTFRNNNVYNLIYVAASDGTTGNRIENNIFTNTTSTATLKGIIRLASGIGPVICNNTFIDNDMPCILIMSNIGAGTRIYQNDFIVPDGISPVALQGPAAAAFPWISPQEVAYTRQGSSYTKVLGNYWNTYDGSDSDGDGIGDTPFTLVTNQIDEAPLKDRVYIYFGQSTPLIAYFTANVTSGETPLAVQFADLSTGSPVSWSWDFGDNSTSTEQNPTHTYTSGGTYTVNLTVTGESGSDSELKTNYITVTSTLPEPPVVNFIGDNRTGPAPLTVHFTDQSTNTPTAWAWDFENDGIIDSTDQNPTYTYTLAGTYQVNLTASNAGGSANRLKGNYIQVTTEDNSNPVVDFSADSRDGTAPFTVQFTDLTVTAPITWAWDFENDGVIDSTLQNPTHTYTIPGTYQVNLSVTNASGTANRLKANFIRVSAPSGSPVAAFTADPGTGRAPCIVRFTDISTGDGITGYEWDFGDGGTSTQENPTHLYRSAGTYTVTLNVISGTGTDKATGTITIAGSSSISPGGNKVKAQFTASPMVGRAPLEVHFTDRSNGATTWNWDFGDGTSSTETSPVHVYSSSGTYRVTLVISGTNGTDTTTGTVMVTGGSISPGGNVNAQFTANPMVGRAPLEVHFTDRSTGAATWNWDFGDGTSSTETSPVHAYSNSGIYKVTLSVSGADGSDTTTGTVMVTGGSNTPDGSVNARFTASPMVGKAPLEVQFTDQSKGAMTWNWDFGDGISSTDENPVHIFTDKGTYRVTLSVSGTDGTDTTTGMIMVTGGSSISPGGKTNARFTASPMVGRAPLEVQFTDRSNWATNQSWDFGDGTNSTDINPVHIFTDKGTYKVTLVATIGNDIESATNTIWVI